FLKFLGSLEETHGQEVREKMGRNYEALGEVADAYLRKIVKALREDARKGQLLQMMKHLGSIFPHLALIAPFVASSFHLHGDRGLLDEVRKTLPASRHSKKILWFTDTLEDLNGVSETLRKIASVAHEQHRNLKLVAPAGVKVQGMPNLVRIPIADEFVMPHYEDLRLSLPSLLPALRLILNEEPDQIILSTPGPMGWLGLLAARILKIPVSGVYHTDFSSQARRIVGDETVVRFIESYLRFFYRQMDALWVPTREYMGLLSARGLDQSRMKLFRRGIDTRLFRPEPGAGLELQKKFGLDGGLTLLYAGRVSQDKNLALLAGVYLSLSKRWNDVNLVIAGDGPWLGALKLQLAGESRVRFTGRVAREDLAPLYAGSDLLVFPSATDTFGMVVLEAQSSGLPCVVNECGGPKEIIDEGQTGFVVRGQSPEDWFRALSDIIARKKEDPEGFAKLGERAREKILRTSRWEDILPDFFEDFSKADFGLGTRDLLKIN
ncbi:MAG: glycosyltransferase, partial [Spirochaetia bacterium]|nr:glycosyltransferase [Spirochaetia bacterium]